MAYTEKRLGDEDIVIKNFKCSEHGVIRPIPRCPKCVPASIKQALAEERKKLVEVIRNQEEASLPDLYSMSDDIISKTDLLSSLTNQVKNNYEKHKSNVK